MVKKYINNIVMSREKRVRLKKKQKKNFKNLNKKKGKIRIKRFIK